MRIVDPPGHEPLHRLDMVAVERLERVRLVADPRQRRVEGLHAHTWTIGTRPLQNRRDVRPLQMTDEERFEALARQLDRSVAPVPGPAYRPRDSRRRARRDAAGVLAAARRRTGGAAAVGLRRGPQLPGQRPARRAAAGAGGGEGGRGRPAQEVAPAPDDGDADLPRRWPRCRQTDAELLRLWAWEQLTPAEIAEVLEITANAASMRLHRAKEKLREQLRKSAAGAGHEESREGRSHDRRRRCSCETSCARSTRPPPSRRPNPTGWPDSWRTS